MYKMTRRDRNELAEDLNAIGFVLDPVNALLVALEDNGIDLLDEDGTPMEMMMFCGEDGRASFDYTKNGEKVRNSMIVCQWHRMESGRYEVIAYAS